MEISITSIAVGIVFAYALLDSICALFYKINNTTIKPSYLKIFTPAISAYVLYGLVTTANESAVTTYVYVTGGLLIALAVLSVLYVCGKSSTENKEVV